MDTTLLPDGIKYANLNQEKFIQKASIMDICNKYRSYERHKNQQHMKTHVNCIRKILDHLTEIGYTSRLKNSSSGWYYYFANTDKIVELLQTNEDKHMETKDEPIVVEKTEQECVKQTEIESEFKFDFDVSKLTGIDLVCMIADKYRNLAFSARKRGIKFDLSIDDVEEIILTNRCYYSNVEFDGDKHIKTVDRINSTQGYVRGNVVVCTKKINHFKNDVIENKATRLFENIHDLKRFVDILFVTQTGSINPLQELLNSDQINTEKKG